MGRESALHNDLQVVSAAEDNQTLGGMVPYFPSFKITRHTNARGGFLNRGLGRFSRPQLFLEGRHEAPQTRDRRPQQDSAKLPGRSASYLVGHNNCIFKLNQLMFVKDGANQPTADGGFCSDVLGVSARTILAALHGGGACTALHRALPTPPTKLHPAGSPRFQALSPEKGRRGVNQGTSIHHVSHCPTTFCCLPSRHADTHPLVAFCFDAHLHDSPSSQSTSTASPETSLCVLYIYFHRIRQYPSTSPALGPPARRAHGPCRRLPTGRRLCDADEGATLLLPSSSRLPASSAIPSPRPACCPAPPPPYPAPRRRRRQLASHRAYLDRVLPLSTGKYPRPSCNQLNSRLVLVHNANPALDM